jgi:hypothetical protein
LDLVMKTIGIEAFLRWVYREELPKAEAPGTGAAFTAAAFGAAGFDGGWDAVSRQGDLMAECVSDGRPNSYGVIPLSSWYGAPPHDDAYAAHAAISTLAEMDFGVPSDWAPLGGLGLSPEEERDAVRRAMPRIASATVDGAWRLRFKPAELIRRHAILGDTPCWEAERPKARFVSANGKPLWFRMVSETIRGRAFEREVDGYNKRAQRPFPGAYRKTVLVPDPAAAAVDRAEYEVWHAALSLLVEMLNEPGKLEAHRLGSMLTPARPWESAAALKNTA